MTGALALLAGVLLALASPALPTVLWLCSSAAVGVCALASPWRHERWVAAGAMATLGFGLAGLEAARWHSLRLPTAGPDTRLLVEGRIATVPVREGEGLRFDLLAGERRFRLHWRDARAAPLVGERWRLLVRLAAGESRNFAGFEVARLAFRDRVHAAGRVLPSALNAPLELATVSVHTVRARIAARVRDAVADPEAAALITALAVGLTGGMSDEQWRVFNATGTTHLVAISGLHVTLFAWLAFQLARVIWGRVRLARHVEREPFALLLGLAAAGGYAWLAGLTVPTQRTWLMLACYVCARLAGRHVPGARLWSVAMVVVLVADPLAPLSAGFWLSFVAVAVLLLFAQGASRDVSLPGRAAALLRVQFAIMLALAPLGFAVFGGVSLVGLLVNLVAIPVISLVFVPVVLVGAVAAWLVPSLCGPPFALATALHDLLWPALTACADLDFASWRATPALPWLLASLPAALVWLCRWPWGLRLGGLCLLLPLLWPSPRAPPRGEAWVSVLDAGRGSAVLIRTRTHTLLYDTGDAWGTAGARLADLVLPTLDAAGRPRVDLLILPRLDDDRARSAAALSGERGLPRMVVGGGWPGARLPARRCGDSGFEHDDVAFRIFDAGSSCVLRIRAAGGGSLLLPGDLDMRAERRLLQRAGAAALASDAVLTSRRTSGAGSSPQWIDSIAPVMAIAAGGVDGTNTRAAVIARWQRSGARLFDTRHDGGIELEIGRTVRVRATAREGRFPFIWRRPPV